jgi:hypothetical protein
MKKVAEKKSEGLTRIASLAEKYASKRSVLIRRAEKLRDQLMVVHERHSLGITTAAAEVKTAKAELLAAVSANQSEFEKPKTRTFFGVKVGFRKLVGSIVYDDAAKVCERIRKLFKAERADLLIKTVETPIADALKQLTVGDLKKLGCEVEADSDVPVVSVPKTDVDKLIEGLLKESSAEGEIGEDAPAVKRAS